MRKYKDSFSFERMVSRSSSLSRINLTYVYDENITNDDETHQRLLKIFKQLEKDNAETVQFMKLAESLNDAGYSIYYIKKLPAMILTNKYGAYDTYYIKDMTLNEIQEIIDLVIEHGKQDL